MSVQSSDIGAKIGGSFLTIGIFLTGQFMVALVWAVHQEGRITATELAISQLVKKQVVLMNNQDNLQARVFSQDTPLAKRVDAIQDRVQNISERILRIDAQIEQLRSK